MTIRGAKPKPKSAPASRGCLPLTLLDAFCRRYAIETRQLAASSRISASHLCRIRAGKVPYVTLDTAKLLALGASRLMRRKVGVGELFDLEIDYRPAPNGKRKAA